MNPSKNKKASVKKNGDYWQIHHEVIDYSKDANGETTTESFKDIAAGTMLGAATLFGAAPDAQSAPSAQTTQSIDKNINLDRLIDVLCKVESNNDPKAVGDKGKALGILQIWKTYVDDVNRIYKTSYKHEDAFNPDLAKEITKKYLSFYGKLYEKRTGKPATYEVLARIHNSGPNGWNKQISIQYWNKVQKYI